MRTTARVLRNASLAVLGLNPECLYGSEDIKHAFHKKARLLHPDAGGDAEKFKELNNAYAALRNDQTVLRPRGATSHQNNVSYHSHYTTAGGSYGDKHSHERGVHRRRDVYTDKYKEAAYAEAFQSHHHEDMFYKKQSTSSFRRSYMDPNGQTAASKLMYERLLYESSWEEAFLFLRFLLTWSVYGTFFFFCGSMFADWEWDG